MGYLQSFAMSFYGDICGVHEEYRQIYFPWASFLECLEDASEEVCDASGVYVKLQNQGWRERFEDRRAVF